MSEPGGEPRPSREASLVWVLVVTVATAVLVSLAFPLAQGIQASAHAISNPSTD